MEDKEKVEEMDSKVNNSTIDVEQYQMIVDEAVRTLKEHLDDEELIKAVESLEQMTRLGLIFYLNRDIQVDDLKKQIEYKDDNINFANHVMAVYKSVIDEHGIEINYGFTS